MKLLRSTLTIFAIFCLLFVSVPQASAEWWINDGGEDILLDRVDNAIHSPLHEIDKGVYGFANQDGKFVTVLVNGNVRKEFEDKVKWIAGPMDYVEK